MTCDCIEKVSSNCRAHMHSKIAETIGFQRMTSDKFDNEVLWMSGDTHVPISIPFTVSYERKAKNGNVREYKKTTSVFPTYCPFCGTKYSGE